MGFDAATYLIIPAVLVPLGLLRSGRGVTLSVLTITQP
jgi:hypothetical protein